MNKLKRATSIAIALGVGFAANEWFKIAWNQTSELARWVMFFIVLVILVGVIYSLLDEDGKFRS